MKPRPILLLMIASLVIMTGFCSITTVSAESTTWHVGGTGYGNITDLTLALEGIEDGDTVILYPGSYIGPFFITSSISLKGADSDNVLMLGEGNEDILTVNSSDSLISDLFFTSTQENYTGNAIKLHNSNSTTIQDCFFEGELSKAISIKTSRGSTVQRCTFDTTGIWIYICCSSTETTIFTNNFINGSATPVIANDPATWNLIFPHGGNYWQSYIEGGALDSNRDGIADEPFFIYGQGRDAQPLMRPWNEQLPVASFDATYDNGAVLFDGSGSYSRMGTILSWDWSLGDGSSDSGMTIEHTYAEESVYLVNLSVTDDHGRTNWWRTLIKSYPLLPPIANFTYQPVTPQAGTTVLFTDNSSDEREIVSRYWMINGCEAIEDVTTWNHTFEDAGSYLVTLRVTDDDGLQSRTEHTIQVSEIPKEGFPVAIAIGGMAIFIGILFFFWVILSRRERE